MSENKMTKEEFLATRRAAGRMIDPETCEIWDEYCQILDPYGVDPPPDECCCIGRLIFVRSSERNGPVCQYDLPDDTYLAVCARISRGDVRDELPF